MNITNYTTIRLPRDSIAENPASQRLHHQITHRKAGSICLYNDDYQLVRILRLADFGVVDKRKCIPHSNGGIEVQDGPRMRLSLELEQELLCVWCQELGLTLYQLDGRERFHLPDPICHAQYDPRSNLLWTVRRDSNDHVTLLVYDYFGAKRASLPMEDPLYQSDFHFSPLPEKNGMAVTFGGGQDGSQDCFLLLEETGLTVTRTLPQDMTFLFALPGGAEALLLDFYQMVLYRCTYPELVEISRFAYPEEDWCAGQVLLLNADTLILTNDCDYRHYLFDLPSMALGEEITVDGYGLEEDSSGILCSPVQQIFLRDGHLVLQVEQQINGEKQELLLVGKDPLV